MIKATFTASEEHVDHDWDDDDNKATVADDDNDDGDGRWWLLVMVCDVAVLATYRQCSLDGTLCSSGHCSTHP